MEKWRKVPDYHYSININDKEYQCRNDRTGYVIKNIKSKGRIFWSLWKNGIEKRSQIGVWIALTYPELIENEYFEGAEIDHIDTDPLNNHPSNLKWVTHRENINNPQTLKNKSKSRTGKKHTKATKESISNSLKGKFINRPNQSKSVLQYTKEGSYIATFPSIKEAERITGVNHRCISACCLKKGYKSAGGYIWKYA